MSDKTFGVKVSEELYDRVKNMVETSGGSVKDWFEKAVAIVAVQDLKDGSGDYKQDLTELEKHTTRIYELVANMIQRANYLKDDAIKGLENKLESRELTITELQGSVKGLKENVTQMENAAKQAVEEKQTLTEQLEGLRSTNENNLALIQQYKEKIDTLSSLINEYKGYATENEELKKSFAAEKQSMITAFNEKENRLLSAIEELKITSTDQQSSLERLTEKLNNTIAENEKEVKSLQVNHTNELTQLTNQKDLEKERAVLEVERKFQEKLQEIHEMYNNKLVSIYEKLDADSHKKKDEEK